MALTMIDPAFSSSKLWRYLIMRKFTIAKEVVLAYPCFSKPFEIYTDASTLQLGAVITQENRLIAFFSQNSLARNLNAPLPN